MSNSFYTSAILDGSRIFYRGIENGKRVKRKADYKPTLYLPSQNTNQEWKSLEGYPLLEKRFDNIWDARSFAKKYADVDNFKIYGNQRYQYAFIGDTFPGLIDFDPNLVRVGFIDIEVNSDNGFPEPHQANEPLTAITLLVDGIFFAFGLGEFKSKDDKVQYIQCADEVELIKEFLVVWEAYHPDIISGWNINIFDIPYLVNRITKLIGAAEASRLSPWGKCTLRPTKIGHREFQIYDLMGVAILDYIDLYKKYAPQPNQESYTLDDIAEVELDRHKLDYKSQGYKDLNDLYVRNHQLYIEYNILDVSLIRDIEEKLRLIGLAQTLAYMNKVNYDDVFSQGRMWDAIIFNKLKQKKIAVPPNKETSKRQAYAGAYVKEPEPGWYKWLASFDLTSLYPHLIMMYNLSVETLVEPDDYDDETREWISKYGAMVNVDNLLDGKLDLSWLKSKKLTITPNCQFFRTDKQGFLPEIMEEMFNERAKYKKMEIDAKKEFEKIADEVRRGLLTKEASRAKALQMALKVTLNSAYGSIGNQFFRYFDVRIAEAVTLTGQLSIRWIQKAINEYFNKILDTKEVDYVLASDTDSVYLSMDVMMCKLLGEVDKMDPKKVIQAMDKICEGKIKPFIDKSYNELANYVSAYAQKMVMKREALADQAIWIAKKNYVLSVYNNEGVEYDKPEVKITGWAAIRTTTPKICRKKLKESVAFILEHKDLDKLRVFVDDFRKQFKATPLIKISSPSGISELDDYSDARGIYTKGTPMHVKAALVYNHYIKSMNLEKKYERIKVKDKIKYIQMKLPNPFQSGVIGFLDVIPNEFGIDKYIDYDAQFNKTFIQPLTLVLDAINWKLEEADSLEGFFS